MTIRLDEGTVRALQHRAERLGVDVERVASDLVRAGLAAAQRDRSATARGILSRSKPSAISSVAMMDQIRNEGR